MMSEHQILELLFQSNWKVVEPTKLRNIMRRYLKRGFEDLWQEIDQDCMIDDFKISHINKYDGQAQEVLKTL